MRRLIQFRARTLLLGVAVGGVMLGIFRVGIQGLVEPITVSGFRGTTATGTKYVASLMVKRDLLGRRQLLNVVVSLGEFGVSSTTSFTAESPRGHGLEVYPNGVFFNGARIDRHARCPVIMIIPNSPHEILELTVADADGIAASGVHSPAWKSRVEPQIDRVVAVERSAAKRE